MPGSGHFRFASRGRNVLVMPANSFNVRAPGEGSKYWIVGDQMCLKLDGGQTGGRFAVAENYIPPQSGPPPHLHRNEDEVFYVLEGRMQFCLGDTTVERGPGAAMFLPRDVPHCFKNVGDGPARFLLMTRPAGFETFVAACGEPIASIPHERAVGPADVEKLLAGCGAYGIEVFPPGGKTFPNAGPPAPAGRRVWALGHKVTFKLTGAETGGALGMVEIESPVGAVVPPHRHREQDEFFYVLSGAYTFTVDGRTIAAPAGTFVHVPAGVAHSLTNAGPGVARVLDVHTPGGFEKFFEECGVPAGDEGVAPETPEPPAEVLRALLERHGMDAAM